MEATLTRAKVPNSFSRRINNMLCPNKVNSNTIGLTVHTSCYWVLDLLCVIRNNFFHLNTRIILSPTEVFKPKIQRQDWLLMSPIKNLYHLTCKVHCPSVSVERYRSGPSVQLPPKDWRYIAFVSVNPFPPKINQPWVWTTTSPPYFVGASKSDVWKKQIKISSLFTGHWSKK